MVQRPGALGIHQGAEVRMGLVQQLLGPEVVKPQKPVSLIEPVLPEQGGLEGVPGGEEAAVRHGQIGREKDALELVCLVEPLGQQQNMPVALRRRADDHLGGLSCGSEARRMAVERQLLSGGLNTVPDLGHWGENGSAPLLRSQPV